MAHSDSARVTL
uniref:Uncharacterized protein n=1 Tax=Anguilla anguilla TaxID=7936 RepID=A0A0E9UY69_ANGAN